MNTKEHTRLKESHDPNTPWKKWGPYLSERQWGTVREDYSESGDAWNYFTHDQARSRAYRWGEDGLAGVADDKQRLCFALALWNGKDPILKERLFGLTNSEGNHGEDVKEYYFYLDSTPTHSYMKYLYKYPQAVYPYADLVETNRKRSRSEFEYELLHTGIFDQDRYYDVFVEYAKEGPEDILIQISVANRGPELATLHVLPTLLFRNTWSLTNGQPKPRLETLKAGQGLSAIRASHPELGERFLYCEGQPPLLFTENETNEERIFNRLNSSRYVKDAFDEFIVHGRKEAVNPGHTGTKAAPLYKLSVAPGETQVIRLRLTNQGPASQGQGKPGATQADGRLGSHFDRIMASRRKEADEFYASITPTAIGTEPAKVMRQALAGMLWSKQYYSLDANRWLEEHKANPMEPFSRPSRNKEWYHMINDDIVSMPDKWEYPWYAAWDLAFHSMALSVVDLDFAKQQLGLMLKDVYLHPNGQVPAYEWNFSDVNPPVHAWATLFLYNIEKMNHGEGDVEFLKRMFNKLALNFTWWVNRKDRFGKNIFEGGFLGLDNIGVFDRSAPLPTGGSLEQADGTAWMALFCQNMLEMAVELATIDSSYQELATKFAEHFFWIAAAVNRVGGGLWDEEDGFYYDVLRLPDGRSTPLKVRSLVGLLPLCATTFVEKYQREQVPQVLQQLGKRLAQMPELMASVHATGSGHLGVADRGILSLVNENRLRRILSRMLDEKEFLSPHGIRSLSRFHVDHPYSFWAQGQEYRVDYLPAESNSGMFGGNSNWRGPVWFPINALIIRALIQYFAYYGDSFQIECPTGSGRRMNLFEVSRELANRLTGIFLPDKRGRRPVYGATQKFQTDPHWRDYILFHEYFHGDNGAGLGASHQTGWTGMVAPLIQIFGRLDAKSFLKGGKRSGVAYDREWEEAKHKEGPATLAPA